MLLNTQAQQDGPIPNCLQRIELSENSNSLKPHHEQNQKYYVVVTIFYQPALLFIILFKVSLVANFGGGEMGGISI